MAWILVNMYPSPAPGAYVPPAAKEYIDERTFLNLPREEAEKYLEINGGNNVDMYRPSFPKVASSATKASPMNRFNNSPFNTTTQGYMM